MCMLHVFSFRNGHACAGVRALVQPSLVGPQEKQERHENGHGQAHQQARPAHFLALAALVIGCLLELFQRLRQEDGREWAR